MGIFSVNEGKIEEYLGKLGIDPQPRGRRETQREEETDWQEVLKKGIERAEDQCSICLTALWNKPVYLLSCTHTFHVNCI